jgi:flagellar biosynthesis GTPase FlhF
MSLYNSPAKEREEQKSWRIGGRLLLATLLVTLLGACSTQSARDAEMAEQEAARVAAEQEEARIAQQRAMQQERERQERAAAEARLQAQREAEQRRRQEAAQARAEQERRERQEAERRERERLAAIAAAEAERRQKLQRIAELEQQIASVQAQAASDQERAVLLQEAIVAAEDLLEVLTAEQAKYENTDPQGNPVEPLAKDLIAELEARKNNLVQQANNQ